MTRGAAFLACLCFAGCEVAMQTDETIHARSTEVRDSSATVLKVAAPLANGLQELPLSLPRLGSKVAGAIDFVFDTTGSPQGMVLLFDREPKLGRDGHLEGGWGQSGCLGGVASMAGMRWNGSLRLDGKIQHDGFHACTTDEHEPLDRTSPITTANLPQGKIWWVVVGYDMNYLPVATSAVYFFLWSPE